jgi:APA family basic amino acid/polyamine antiporter
MPTANRPYKVWGYPVVPAIVILFSAALFVNTIATQPREAIIGLALMLTGFRCGFGLIENEEKNQ